MSRPNFASIFAVLRSHMASELDPARIRALFTFDPARGLVRFRGDTLPDLRLSSPRHARWDVTMADQEVDAMPYGRAVVDELVRAQSAEFEKSGVHKGRVIHLTWHETSRRPAGLLASIAFHVPEDNGEELVITAIGTNPDEDVAADAHAATWVLKQYLHALAPKTSNPEQKQRRRDTVVRSVAKTSLTGGIRESLDLLGFEPARFPRLRATSDGFRQQPGISARLNTRRARR